MLTNEREDGVLVTPTAADGKPKNPKFNANPVSMAPQIAHLIELLRRGPRSTHTLQRIAQRIWCATPSQWFKNWRVRKC